MKKFLLICLTLLICISFYGSSVFALDTSLVEKCPNIIKNINDLFQTTNSNVHILDCYGDDITRKFIEDNRILFDNNDMDNLLKYFSKECLTMYIGEYDSELEFKASTNQPISRASTVVSKDFGQFYTLLTTAGGSITHGELGYYIRCKGSYNYETGRWTNVQDPILVDYGGTYFAESGWEISSNRSISGSSVTYKNVYVYFWGSRQVGMVGARIHFDSFTPNKNLVIKA
ncbi:hypothetical protein [Thomasclavelia cocleata]|uniref:hypothetical protein n=1 Tax=Thomasclavelia cocleata TaxID=69824 RepID=UPI002557E762|nr:hypothetical protein [Thomasclavelia cocleata]